MDWGGGLIGWQASTSHYDSFYLSGYDDNNEIGCMFSFTSSAIVFKVSERKHFEYTISYFNTHTLDISEYVMYMQQWR